MTLNPITTSEPAMTPHSPLRAPAVTPAGLDAIRGRILVAAGEDAFTVAAHLKDRPSGLVLTGTSAAKHLAALHATYPGLPILADLAPYARYNASAEQPFAPTTDGTDALLPATDLTELALAQRNAGAAMAVIAMGFLDAGDADPLRAAVAMVNEIEVEHVLFVVPASHAWLRKRDLTRFIGILKQCKHPVAVALNHPGNPLEDAECVHGYRTLFETLPDATAWRTDHNGLGALAHGAAAAVIGVRPSLRHISVLGDHSRTPKNRHPQIFERSMMLWGKANHLRQGVFTTVHAAACPCGTCDGADPTRFRDTPAGIEAGQLHNIDALLLDRESIPTEPAARKAWWRDRVIGAVSAVERYKLDAQRPKYVAAADLRNWLIELR
jgi:hypothetical protein